MAIKRKKKRRPLLALMLIVLITFIIIFINNKKDLKENNIPIKTSYINNISYENKDIKHINPKAEQTIVTFMDLYYRSMKELKVYDLTPLFSGESYEQAQITQTSLSLLVDIRLSQVNDLSLTDCSYDIKYYDIKDLEDTLVVTFYEGNSLNFKFINNTPSKSYNIKNIITLEKANYKIVAYEKVDDFYNMIKDNYKRIGSSLEEVKATLTTLKNSILSDVNDQIVANQEEYTAYVNGEVDKEAECNHPYDRVKASNYAKEWVNKRNPEWYAYDIYGGNCNNYASQAILTGGIPMDYTGPINEQWKHYSNNVVEESVAKGRSYSWTGVNQFYTYAKNNNGYGMCAKVDVNLYFAEPGDIIQVGSDGAWKHTVMVTDVIKKDGKVVDILINSNSIDRENYPVSAYNYANKRLIKIYGWND